MYKLTHETCILLNKQKELIRKNNRDQPIVIGCNYHTTWQDNKSMRFILTQVINNKCNLVTRTTRTDIWVDIDDLIFITTRHNISKGKKLRPMIDFSNHYRN